MFIGQIEDWAAQKNYLPKALVLAFEETRAQDLAHLEAGQYPLKSVNGASFVLQTGSTKMIETTKAEVHGKNIDIQYLIFGKERMGMAHRQEAVAPTEDHLKTKDYALYTQPPEEFFVELQEGQFVIFFPGEIHRPFLCCADDVPSPIRKVVVKVPREAVY